MVMALMEDPITLMELIIIIMVEMGQDLLLIPVVQEITLKLIQ
jgi:hypothetical protein